MPTTQTVSERVAEFINDTLLIAFDGCHKIYLALDEIEADWFRENYEITMEDAPEIMLEQVVYWYDISCSLRFVSGVRHDADDPNAGFVTIIGQFDDEYDEDEEE